ncbi:MAG: AAA domain-containing protein, partial [Caldimicrobium sp.]
ELEKSQKRNYFRMKEEKIACIEGPPGTGKTRLIVQFCIDKIFEKLLYSFEEKGDIKPILITSTNNKAVDNVYEKLNEIVKKIFQENEFITGKYIEGFLRFGHKNLSDKTKQSIKEKLAGIQESEISVNLEKLKTEIQPLYEFVKNYLNKKEDVYNKIKTLRETKIQLENKMREKNELEAYISELSELLFVNSEKAFSFTRENLKTFQQKWEKLNRASKKFFWRSLNWVMDLFKSSPKWDLYRYCKDRGINLSGLNDIKYLSPEDIINRNSDILNKLEEFVTKNEKVANLEKEISEFFQKQEILIEEINKLSEKLDKEKDKYMKDAKILFARLLEYQFWKAIEEDPKLKNFKPEENSWGYVKSFSIIAPVMLTTALSIRNDFPLNKDLFDTVIIDEGSQMLLTYALPIYLRGERLIVVGDTHQLGPVTQLPSNGAHRDELENYFKELPDHLIYKNSVMEALEKIDKTDPSKRRLKEHFRCNKDIIGFCNELIGYGLEVYIKEKSVPNLDKLPEELRKIFEKPMAFINVKGQSAKTASGSKRNEKEANFIKGLIETLTRYFEPTDIAIITPYRAQSDRIFNVLKKNNKISSEIDKLVIGTVHRLQGDERKIVLISAVDTDPKEIIRSPLWSSKNLVNVAVSRAENHLILIGCENAIEQVKDKENPLYKLYIYIKEKGCTFNKEDFQFLEK